jgi:prepilin-type N-terminal cleavage/methylation domain-containing protein
MIRRNGVTLIEVLVAIFVMGIGMLALLSLFPLGIYRMQQSIQAEKATQACQQATAIANFQKIRTDPWVWTMDANPLSPTYLQLTSTVNTFSNPQWPNGTTWQGNNLLPADPGGMSFPIYVDPMGYNAGSPAQFWLTPSGDTIPRRSVSFVQPTANPINYATRWFSLRDDIVWGQDGTPDLILPPSGPQQGLFNRNTRYSWSLMLQRTKTSDPSSVNLTVAVFARSPDSPPLNEMLYQTGEVGLDPVNNAITLTINPANNVLPPARLGEWLLDASYVPSATGPYASANANFYRIVSITQNNANSITYSVQPPLRNFPATGSSNTWQKIIYMENLVEVFEKGTGWQP